MFVGALKAEFTIPGCRSLKEKRKPLRSLKERVKNKFNCSVSEVGFNDKWQRVALGIAVTAGEEKLLREQLDSIKRFLRTDSEMALTSIFERVFDKLSDEDLLCDSGPPADLLFMDTDETAGEY
ncbi:MAG: DUF503 domain-containing protein [Planctomycetota bacterium]|jgi:uncharacterized protein YlxP (DUF503 family)